MMNLFIISLGILLASVTCREFELESFTPSANTNTNLIDYGTVRVKKVQRNNFALFGDFELKKNLGNEKAIMFEIFLPDGNLLFRQELPVCDYIKREVMIWPKLEKASNLPKNKPCPLPKGNYTIENFVIDDSAFGPLPYGKYLAKGKLIEDKKILTQIDIVAWMNP